MRQLLLLGLLAAPAPGIAQLADVICETKPQIEKRLTEVFGATRHGRGMRGPDALMEMWVSNRSGEWTLVQSYANGTACIVAMGEYWEAEPPTEDPA